MENAFNPIFSSVFTLPPKTWTFELDKNTYGVDVAGYLTGATWTNSPIIFYGEIIHTNYYFELFTRLSDLKKTSSLRDIKYEKKTLSFNSPIKYDMTFWQLPGIVFEYITYFAIDRNTIASFVMSTQDRNLLGTHFNEYKTLLQNFVKVAGTLRASL